MNPCPICLIRAATVTDHDHATGIVRGRLCPQCNTGIGLLGDERDRLARAILYLERDPDGALFADVDRERQRLAVQRWRANNPERDRSNRRAWVADHRETMRDAVRRYRANDPDGSKKRREREQRAQWARDNPDKIAEYNRRRREKLKG